MTKNELKEYLKNFRKIQAQKQYFDLISKYDKHSRNHIPNFILFECIKLSLTILDNKEYFIIKYHLILQSFGSDSSRTDRTLKRIQNLALEKMLTFINDLNFPH